MSDRRAVEGAGPYGADGGSPVGAIHESPADLRLDPTNGLSRTPAPTQQTKVLVSLRTCQGTHKLYGSFVAKNL